MECEMSFFDYKQPSFPKVAISDYREIAFKRLPRQLFDFLEGGAFDEITVQKNRDDFQQIQLKKRVLKDTSNLSMTTELLGQKFSFPLGLAPVGFAGVYGRRGEVQAARSASKALIPFSLSTVSICSIEEVAQNSSAPFWFQFYMFKDRHHSLDLLQRAQNVGCPVLLLTVDLPVAGARHRYHRSRYAPSFINFLKEIMHLRWWIDVRLNGSPLTVGNLPTQAPNLSDLPIMRKWMGSQISQSLTWKDFEWIRANWKGKILVKGILEAEDALMAKEIGADGIVVSNHGGRHIDSTSSTIAALPRIREAIADDFKVLIDGGISSGLDIFKALALGADACMIGKPWIYGLAARGEAGISEILNILQNELKIAMIHFGTTSVHEINRDLIKNLEF
jgi:L-lactate dehydrogenase (cytochrome)